MLVVLNDVEKAHTNVLNVLLQIMDSGILRDAKGQLVPFNNCILVLTSNVGSKRILELQGAHDRTTNGRPEYSKLVVAIPREFEESMNKILSRINDIVIL